MSNVTAFQALGSTALLNVSGTSSNVQVTTANGNAQQYVVANLGPNTAYLAFSPSPDVEAVIPTAGSPSNGMPIGSGQTFAFTGPPNAWWAGISTGTASCFITPGEGM